jgi:hypothetical protein
MQAELDVGKAAVERLAQRTTRRPQSDDKSARTRRPMLTPTAFAPLRSPKSPRLASRVLPD